ncbi:MAG: hypothetical protein ACI4IQ_00125 [Eubacterium sp.]
MPIKFNDIFSNTDEPFNSAKLEEMLNKTRDVAETMSKKSAERIELGRKRVECLDAKAKLSKYYEKFGRLQYAVYTGEEVDAKECEDIANHIAELREKIAVYTEDIEAAKAAFNESVANVTKKAKDGCNTENTENNEK